MKPIGEKLSKGRGIHHTAVVSPKAELGEGVFIGPYCIIEDDVIIGDGSVLEAYVVVKRYTRLGAFNHVHTGAVLGGEPQDLKFRGERSYLVIGDHNVIREYVTIHRATGEDESTAIGRDNMIMAYCHIGHNCMIGNNIQLASYSGISGHCLIEDYVVIGGMAGVHQFTTIGKLAMIGGLSKVNVDVPPFMMADGRPAKVVGLNIVGLRRDGIPPKARTDLNTAYKILYRSDLNTSQAIERILTEIEPSPPIEYLISFLGRICEGYLGRQLSAHKG